MVHFSQLLSTAVLVSVSSAIPMARRYAPSATMNTYNSYQSGSYQSSDADSSYGSGYDSSYGSVDSSYSASDSSYAGSDSSYAGSDSSYGSSDSSYGSMDSSYGNSWDSMSVETETMLETATTSSSYYIATQTSSAMYTQATYGSGSTSWGGSSGYNSCVQQCQAQFGAPPTSTMAPSEEVSSTNTGSSATTTHTIIVAPSQGVLKYVPFATNANPGDLVTFQWLAGTHTVTQSSAVEVCNKTANGFASGMRTAPSMFNQVINDTNPIWFYCGVPGHCEKGMFGGINIGMPQETSGSNSSYMPMSSALTDMAQDPDISSAWNYTLSVVGANSNLSSWGMDINCAGMNDDTMKNALLNVLYTQAVMAKNPNVFQNGKVVGPTSSLSLPEEFVAQTNGTNNATQTNTSSGTTSTPNGVPSFLAPRFLVAFVAVLVSLTLF